jgi:hypothetical protein
MAFTVGLFTTYEAILILPSLCIAWDRIGGLVGRQYDRRTLALAWLCWEVRFSITWEVCDVDPFH